ncbi:MAG: BrnT family toxin [Hyphomicrobiales bacterium]|nr:BrnT family toxin [Hyphomicrobiales bacterium]MBV9428638.1 BrnT family toxin [Bradyrhizobiaceae bacterium]
MNADDFEWDDAKAAANLAKHGVTFEQARDAFNDPFAVDFVDDRANYREHRLILLGMVESRLLTVVHTLRGEKVRIISAREAEPHERRRYHEENR